MNNVLRTAMDTVVNAGKRLVGPRATTKTPGRAPAANTPYRAAMITLLATLAGGCQTTATPDYNDDGVPLPSALDEVLMADCIDIVHNYTDENGVEHNDKTYARDYLVGNDDDGNAQWDSEMVVSFNIKPECYGLYPSIDGVLYEQDGQNEGLAELTVDTTTTESSVVLDNVTHDGAPIETQEFKAKKALGYMPTEEVVNVFGPVYTSYDVDQNTGEQTNVAFWGLGMVGGRVGDVTSETDTERQYDVSALTDGDAVTTQE